jgi:hypothetical protein
VVPIGPLLRPGKNVIAILAYHRGEDFSDYKAGSPGLIAAAAIGALRLATDGQWRARPHTAFRSGPMPRVTPQMGFTTEFDAAREEDWAAVGFDDGDWPAAAELAGATDGFWKELRPRPVQPLAIREPVPVDVVAQGDFLRRAEGETLAQTMMGDALVARRWWDAFAEPAGSAASYANKVPAPGMFLRLPDDRWLTVRSPESGMTGRYFIVDAGREEVGLLTFRVDAPAGAILDISHGEHLDDGRVRAAIGNRNFADRYVCKGGVQEFTLPFRRLGGRYIQVQVSGCAAPVRFDYVGLRPVELPLEQSGAFTCSDSMAERIYGIGVRTLRLCMHEHYEDCPWREQALYAYDSRNQALYGYQAFGNYDFAAASFDLLGRGLREDGLLELCAPARCSVTIPMFSLVWIVEVAEHWMYSGAPGLFETFREQIASMLMRFIGRIDPATGLCRLSTEKDAWQFYEWEDELAGTVRDDPGAGRLDAPLSLYLHEAIGCYAWMLEQSGDGSAAAPWRRRQSALGAALRRGCWDGKRRLFATYRMAGRLRHQAELVQALAAYAGLVRPRELQPLLRRAKAKDVIPMTISSRLYEVLGWMPAGPAAREAVADSIRTRWGGMALSGATSFWETELACRDWSDAGSLCHGWSALPVYYYQAWVLGVRPLSPGFGRFLVQPYPDRFAHAEGRIPTPQGPISIRWERQKGGIRVEAEGPDALVPQFAGYPESPVIAASYNGRRSRGLSPLRRFSTAVVVGALAFLAVVMPEARASMPLDQVPLFRVRGQVLESGGAPVTTNDFTFSLGGSNAFVRGSDWSPWLQFTRDMAAKALSTYPNSYARYWPVVTRLGVFGGHDPCKVRIEVQPDGLENVRTFEGELYGSQWGLLLWPWQGKPYVATMCEYNRMAWNSLPGDDTAAPARLQHLVIADRFIAGDQDRVALREGISGMARAGFSVLMVEDSGKMGRDCLLQAGLRRTAAAVYSPPGSAFDHTLPHPDQTTAAWVEKIVTPLTNAGFARTDLALLAMADETGWYYPSCFAAMTNNPVALGRFRAYLQDQGLRPADVGAGSWNDVWPKGRGSASDLPSRRLFYWTMRFFPWDSARYFADCTRALESAFYTNLPVFVNWNFFSGRFYVPGPVANNPAKSSPDAAMGGHDWMEFGRLRGSTMLWTEDWFVDELAYQWSYYCARLRSAARRGGLEFGGYIVPRSAGQREEGLLQKAAAILGHGGKAIKYFTFGPEYNFPGNCYSLGTAHLPRLARAHRLIATAEPLLWPGRPRPADVALLMPRSAQAWDPRGIEDATNVRLNHSTVDYMAEVYNLYLAFMHANIPVDFVEEDQLTVEGLKGLKALYVTEPNIPEESQKALVAWVSGGGTLVTISGAGQRDRYNEPCPILRRGLGIPEKDRERLMLPNLYALPGNGEVTGTFGRVHVIGTRSQLDDEKGLTVEARFDNGEAALVSRAVGRGRTVHYNWMPGLAYGQSPKNRNGMFVDWPAPHREAIVGSARQAGVRAAVRPDRPMVEAPLLESAAGAVVTLLNWTGDAVTNLTVEMDWLQPVSRVESAARGPLPFRMQDGILSWSVPLDGADFIMIRP